MTIDRTATGPFATVLDHAADGSIAGPWRTPAQMLAAQTYDNHASIHDDATANKLGFQKGTIEGPTHFSQFEPLGAHLWGRRWFEEGCISAHYRNAAYEGESVRAFMSRPTGDATHAQIWMLKEDGSEVLRGTASVGGDNPSTALEQRLSGIEPPATRVILQDVTIGMKASRQRVQMDFDQNMGAYYPFTLTDKLGKITERSAWFTRDGAAASPFGRPILPMEMISVLLSHLGQPFPVRRPSVGLFADQEIRLIRGPLFAGCDYEIEREVVALSGSRRTESLWVRTSVFPPGSNHLLASMLLNTASLKDSYPDYEAELSMLGQ